MRKFKIVLTSGSELKMWAVEEGMRQACLNRPNFEIITVKADSGVNEQPFGLEEGFRGAENRALAGHKAHPDADLILSIESCIIEIGPNSETDDISYHDVGCVLAMFNPENCIKMISQSVPFPYEAVEATMDKEGGFVDNTVGQTMQEMGLVEKADDPHADITRCLSRGDILAQVIYVILNQIDDLPRMHV